MLKENLGGIWKMKAIRSGNYYDFQVPGSLIQTLIDKGEIEDPYFGDNADKCINYLKEDYELTRMLQIAGEHLREDEIDLVFYGIDTIADIFLNGELLSSVNDMHRTYRFSIKGLVRPGANELKLVLHSPLKFIEEYLSYKGQKIDNSSSTVSVGSQYIRKAHSMFGNDFGIKLPDMGIFRDIELQSYSKSRIVDVVIKQQHEEGNVTLFLDPILKIVDNIPIDIEVLFGNMKPIRTMIRMPKAGKTMTEIGENTIRIDVERPLLWWPHGLGEQNLYDLTIKVSKAGKLYDKKVMKIGLRTMEFSNEKDEEGSEFAFIVNGVKMFAMGANYVPQDAIYSRIDEKREEMIVKAAADANFNCLRVWGGGYYPSDNFYNLCDEYGIIVWQDLMFSSNVYELSEEFEQNIIAETKDNVRRIKHHACLGLWCGNSEIEYDWENNSHFKNESKCYKADYIKIFEYLLPKALRKIDDKTFYWPSSPSSGGSFDNPNDNTRGDSHFEDVWKKGMPFSECTNYTFRFLSEFGFQSYPGIKTASAFTNPEDRNAFSYVFEKHENDSNANGRIMAGIADNFLYPESFEKLLYVSQILQGLAVKTCVEHLRRNRGKCMGTLYWHLNDNWPVVSCSSVDYFGRYKVLHYLARRFYEPISQSLVLEKNEKERTYSKFVQSEEKLAAYVVNDTLDSIGVKCRMTLKSIDGKEIVHYDDSAHILPGKAHKVAARDFSRYIERNGINNVYVEATFEYTDKRIRQETYSFVPYKYLKLEKPEFSIEVEDKDELFEITIQSNTYAPFVFLDIAKGDAVFEENVFDLSANIPKKVELFKDRIRDVDIPDASRLKQLLTVVNL